MLFKECFNPRLLVQGELLVFLDMVMLEFLVEA